MQPTKPEIAVKVFICYAHEDQELRKKLEEHLSPLIHSGMITLWHDQEILAGAYWDDQINTHLRDANLILLLVSASFIASKYCWNNEVQAALERHRAGTARVIPIILKPVQWQKTPLGQLQALPTGAKSIIQWNDQDAAFDAVVQGIGDVVERFQLQEKKMRERTNLQRIPDDHGMRFKERRRGMRPQKPNRLGRRLWLVLVSLVGIAAVIWAAFIWVKPSPSPHSNTLLPVNRSPSPSTPLVSYRADWATGFGDWKVSSQWSDEEGTLISNGSLLNDWIFPSTSVPFSDSITKVQIQRLAYNRHESGMAFGIVVRYKAGSGGYVCGIGIDGSGEHAFIAPVAVSTHDGIDYIQQDLTHSQAFTLDNQWHMYQVDVHSSTITFQMDNQTLGHIDDKTYLGGEQIGLYASYAVLHVKNLIVSSLKTS